MPSLKDCQEMIQKLAQEKGWGEDVGTKIFYAMIELGEAGDVWKHRADSKYLMEKVDVLGRWKDLIAEELIDTIFYCLHGLLCLNPKLNPDELFDEKLRKNRKRNRIYIDDSADYRHNMKEANTQ